MKYLVVGMLYNNVHACRRHSDRFFCDHEAICQTKFLQICLSSSGHSFKEILFHCFLKRYVCMCEEWRFATVYFTITFLQLALHVLSFLEPKDLLVAAQTCRTWQILCEDSLWVEWRLYCMNFITLCNIMHEMLKYILVSKISWGAHFDVHAPSVTIKLNWLHPSTCSSVWILSYKPSNRIKNLYCDSTCCSALHTFLDKLTGVQADNV